MFFSSEDDEHDFLSSGRSKLANVFGLDKASSQGGNESLTYTAPKQPKKKEPVNEVAASTNYTIAIAVQAYKFLDNQYVSQGKVGAAIVANHPTHEYRILLYISKQPPLTSVRISPTFNFTIQANNYANFYDDARINWSVMFTNAQESEKFAKEVALARALSSDGNLDTVVQQDLQLGEGGGLETGDSVEVKYTGWLLTKNTIGQVFDSNTSADKPFRFKVGKGKVIKGWDIGMLGARKGSKRLLIIPPSLAYGSQGSGNRVPPNSTLIFEVEVVRVKLQKSESDTSQSSGVLAPPVLMPNDAPGWEPGEDTVKERSRSISEQLTNSPTSDKAKLISRMAKMGQPMLPMTGAIPAQPDSEEEPPSPQPVPTKPQLPSKPHLMHSQAASSHIPPQTAHMQMVGQPGNHPYTQLMGQPLVAGLQPQTVPVNQPAFLQNLPGSQQLSLYQAQPTLLQQQQQALLAMQQQIPGFNLPVPQAPSLLGQPTSMSDPMAPLLLSESRQQNTEVRLAVSKMSDKVDRILEKVENFNTSIVQHQPLPAPTMETSILLHNISRIVQENERLKKDVYERGEKIEIQNEKIAELLQKNQRYVEKSNTMLEERNEGYKLTANQSQVRVQALEEEKLELATSLSSTTARLAALQLELGELRKSEGELKQRLQAHASGFSEQKEELDRLRLQRAEDEKKLTELITQLREEKTAKKQRDAQLTALQEELADVKTISGTLERNLNESKRKAADERKRMEEEVEESKASYEKEIQSLREKLRKQRTSTDVVTADKVAKIEEELTSEWQVKCDKLLAAAADKHSKQLSEVQEELREAQHKARKLEAKLQEMRSTSSSTDVRIAQLEQELEENLGIKDKYDNLRNQASTMKEKYEERISELSEELEATTISARDLKQQLQRSQQQLQQQQQALSSTAAVVGSAVADVALEVKKIMNSVFQHLRAEFDAEESYTGAEVLAAVLAVIKETTLKLIQDPSKSSQDSQKAVQDDGQEEEEEDEDDEEEEQDEVEDVPVEETIHKAANAASVEAVQLQNSQHKALQSFKESVEEEISSQAGVITGDRGNPSYSRFLDATSELIEDPLQATKNQMTGDRGNPYYSRSLDKNSDLIEAVVKASTSNVTGDGGNPYYSRLLDANSDAVEGLMRADIIPVTGDKGNPYYSRFIDDASPSSDQLGDTPSSTRREEIVSSAAVDVSSDTSTAVEISTPASSLAAELEASNTDILAAAAEAEENNFNSLSTKEQNRTNSISAVEVETVSPATLLSPSSSEDALKTSASGDLSDIYEDALSGKTPPLTEDVSGVKEIYSEAETNSYPRSKQETTLGAAGGADQQEGEPADLVDSVKHEIESPASTSTQHIPEKRTGSAASDTAESVLPTLAVREPPPLFDDDDDDDDSPLFGSDTTVADTLGTDFKQAEGGKEVQKGKPAVSAPKLPSKNDLLAEDDLKPKPPPPLFGDDDDDEDLDWLN